MGQPIPQLAEALSHAAKSRPGNASYLLDLATRKSKLPAWMTAPSDIHIEVKTREASATSGSSANSNTAGIKPQLAPAWTQNACQPAQVSSIPTPILTPRKAEWGRVHGQAWTKAIKYGFLGLLLFWIWVPLLQGIGKRDRRRQGRHVSLYLWIYVIARLGIGYITSWNAEQKRVSSSSIITPPPPVSLDAASACIMDSHVLRHEQ